MKWLKPKQAQVLKAVPETGFVTIPDPSMLCLQEARCRANVREKEFRGLCNEVALQIYTALGTGGDYGGYTWYSSTVAGCSIAKLEKFVEDMENGLVDRVMKEYIEMHDPGPELIERIRAFMPKRQSINSTLVKPSEEPNKLLLPIEAKSCA